MDREAWQNIPHKFAELYMTEWFSLFIKGGVTVLEVLTCCVPLLPGKGIKPSFLLLHNSAPLFLFCIGAQKAKIWQQNQQKLKIDW